MATSSQQRWGIKLSSGQVVERARCPGSISAGEKEWGRASGWVLPPLSTHAPRQPAFHPAYFSQDEQLCFSNCRDAKGRIRAALMRQEVEAWIRNAWLHGKIRGVLRQTSLLYKKVMWSSTGLQWKRSSQSHHTQFVTLAHKSYHIMTWLRKANYNTRINLAAHLAPDTVWFLHLREGWINSRSQQHHCHNMLVLPREETGRITSVL